MAIDPLKYYQRLGQHSEGLVIACANAVITANGQTTLIAAATGKRHRVMGFHLQSSTATQAAFEFRDGASTVLWGVYDLPPNTAAPLVAEIKDCGYFETSTGNALIANVVDDLVVSVFYVTYTP